MLWYRFNAWPVIGAMGELSETICPVPAKITTLDGYTLGTPEIAILFSDKPLVELSASPPSIESVSLGR
jgi:hypothetical protein